MTLKNKVNLRDCFCSGVKPEIAYEYVFYINDEEHQIKEQTITGQGLHVLAGTNADTHFISMVTSKGKAMVGPNIEVNLTECGIERFIILPYEQKVLDLHQCFCDGVKPVITYSYKVKINRDKYSINKEKVTKEDLLALVGQNPKTYRLRMFTETGKVIIEDGQLIDLTECGVERFVSEELSCTEGLLMSNLSSFPESDQKFLNNFGCDYEILSQSGAQWLLIRNFGIPDGYTEKVADVAIMIPPHYPTTALDMIYFHPGLQRKDGKVIGQLSSQMIEGKGYQRWSRHRTNGNPWQSDIDDIESHLDLMCNCLKAEFDKR